MSGPIGNHDENSLSVNLTFGELAFLSAASGCKELFFMDSSVQSMVAEDVQAAIQNGQKSLELRGMVTFKSPNDLTVDDNLCQFLRPVLFPEWVLRMEASGVAGVETVMVYYRQYHLIAEQGQGQYRFTMFRENRLLQAVLLQKAGVANQSGKEPERSDTAKRTFITRLIFTRFEDNRPTKHSEITISGNDDSLWVVTSNGLEQSVTAEQLKKMEFV